MKYRILMGTVWFLGPLLLAGLILGASAIALAHTPDESVWSVHGAWAVLMQLIHQQGTYIVIMAGLLSVYGATLCPWPGTPRMRTRLRIQRADVTRREHGSRVFERARLGGILVWMLVYVMAVMAAWRMPFWVRIALGALLATLAREGIRFCSGHRRHR